MKPSVGHDTDYLLGDFARYQSFFLVAETPEDCELLRLMVELRERTSLRAVTWQFEINPRRPMVREFTRVDLRLVDRSVFDRREVDNPAARSGAKKNAD